MFWSPDGMPHRPNFREYTSIPLIGGFAQRKPNGKNYIRVCYTAVFRVVTRGTALRDDTKTAV